MAENTPSRMAFSNRWTDVKEKEKNSTFDCEREKWQFSERPKISILRSILTRIKKSEGVEGKHPTYEKKLSTLKKTSK